MDNNMNNNDMNGVAGNANENVEQNGAFSGAGQEQDVNPNMNQNQGYGYEQESGYMNNNMNPNQDYYGQQSGYQMNNQGYQYPPQGGYQQELEEPVSMGEWLVSLLLITFVPCVNIILLFVWAFSKKEKKSKSNFFKAQLILTGILLVLYIIIFFVFGVTILAGLNAY